MTKILSRRVFLRIAGFSAAYLAVTGRLWAAERLRKPTRPNIIFIMADDLGYGDLGCYGQKLIKTPNIDSLAKQGTRFTHCYAGSTVCAPSRSVLMTGQHTGHTRVRDNSPKVGGVLEAFGEGSRRLPLEAEDVTVAEVLKEAGYVTGITGKWGLGEPNTDGIPNKQGFDEWLGYLNQNHAPYYYTDYLWHNDKKKPLEGNKGGKREQYSQDLFTDFAVDFIKRHKDGSFFLYVPYCIPHRRFEVPSTAPYADNSWPENAKIYAAMITLLDKYVGRIMQTLKEVGVDDNTIVFFCSDNGAEQHSKKTGWKDLFDSFGPLRGAKGTPYEGGIRVPMIVRWPGHVPNGVLSEKPWYFADFMPTAAELAGARPAKNIDGISILPTLLGKEQELSKRYLYWELFTNGFQQIVRFGDFKGIKKGSGSKMELYNLKQDISESNNIASKYPDIVAQFEAYLRTARTDSPNWPIPGKKEGKIQ